MPEAASKGSLEDILASIRQSLADETVDGLVKLSAAAAAAARAEAKQGGKPKAALAQPQFGAAADLDATDAQSALTGKLAGALKAEDLPADDLSELLAEHVPLDAPEEPEDQVAPVQQQGDNALSKMWFLRPGAPEERPPASGKAPGPTLSLDPFADTGKTPSTLASRMKALAPDTGTEADPPEEAASAELPAVEAPAAEPPVKSSAPRLDREKIELINKLKASSAAAVESIGFPADVVDLRSPETAAPIRTGSASDADFDDGDAAVKALLARPERSTPLFGAEPDQRRPIVSAPLPASMLLPQAAQVPEPEVEALSEAPAPAATDAETVDLDAGASLDGDNVSGPEPMAFEAEAPPQDEPAEEASETSGDVGAAAQPDAAVALLAHFQTARTVASVAPGMAADPATASMPKAAPAGVPATKPLEDMIAALLQPVMQRVLDKNLGPMLETLVRREVEKALKERFDG